MLTAILLTICLTQSVDSTATTPIPRDNDWWVQRVGTIQQKINEMGKRVQVLFIGDSITQGWEGNGATVWEEHIAPIGAVNLGIGGDRTEHVLWRFNNGHLDGLSPKAAVVMIGTNNFGQKNPDSADEVLEGVVAVVDALQIKLPRTHILLLDIFPRGKHFNAMRGNILQVNQALQAKYDSSEHVTFLQIGHNFIESDGSIDQSIMPDSLHLSEEGYSRWADAIIPVVKNRLTTVWQIDLANDTNRQVTIDKEAGQYLGHPTTVLLEDGSTILCIYPKGHGKGQLVMKKSIDGGSTWSDRLPVPESWSTSKETPHLYQVEDAQGTSRLILFSSLYPIRMSVSEDDGETWSELEPIGNYGGIVGMADVINTGKGSYTAFFHDDGRFIHNSGKATGLFYVYAVDSSDGGLTWSDPRVVAHDPTIHLCEPGLIESPDGTRFAMLLRENSRKKNSHICFSDDNGITWSTPVEMDDALIGDRHQAAYTPDGRLFISFRDTNKNSDTVGDWVGWIGSFEDLERGLSGDYRVRLSDNFHSWDCAYPGVEVLADGTIFTATYGHWDKGQPPYIRGVHLSLEELDSMF